MVSAERVETRGFLERAAAPDERAFDANGSRILDGSARSARSSRVVACAVNYRRASTKELVMNVTHPSTHLAHDSSAPPTPAASWFQKLVRTDSSVAPLVARVALGLVMFPHGAQKALGWFGGYGFTGTMGFLTGQAKLPYPVALVVIASEFLGAIGLITGTLSRVAALGVASVMIGAVLTVHLHNGFFMNWTGAQAGEGFEYHILALALAAIVLIKGAGKGSVDLALWKRAASR